MYYDIDEPKIKSELLVMLKALHERMSSLSIDELAQKAYGICFEVSQDRRFLADHDQVLEQLFTQWPHTSGLPGYPVPGVEGRSAWMEYASARAGETGMWVGPYGAYRWDLLNWLIDHLENADG